MKFMSEFEERGYKIQAFMPNKGSEPLEWVVKVFKEGVLVKEITIPMRIVPRFGPDTIDVQILEKETEKLLKSLP